MDNAICRICLNSSETLVDIFNKRQRVYKGQQEPCLADMLNECADCYIKSDDALPQQICASCVLSAQNAFRFKRTCEENYRQLVARHKLNARTSLQAKSSKNKPTKAIKTNANEDPVKQELQTESKAVLYKCQSCTKEFAHLSLLRMHKKWHLQTKSNKKLLHKQIPKVNKIKECPMCQVKCQSRDMLKKHLLTHNTDRPFACTHCSTNFQLNCHLIRHIRVCHTDERPYQCPHCSERFARSDYCRRHMDKLHSDLEFTGKLPKNMSKT